MLSVSNLDRYAARLTDVLLKDGVGRDAEIAADVDGAPLRRRGRYAPDGFLQLLTRQKPAGRRDGHVRRRLGAVSRPSTRTCGSSPAPTPRPDVRAARPVRELRPGPHDTRRTAAGR